MENVRKQNKIFVCWEEDLVESQDEINKLLDDGWEVCFFDKLNQKEEEPGAVMFVLERPVISESLPRSFMS